MKLPNLDDADNVFKQDVQDIMNSEIKKSGKPSKYINDEMKTQILSTLKEVDANITYKLKSKQIFEDENDSDIFGSESLGDSDDQEGPIEMKKKISHQKTLLRRISIPNAMFVPGIKRLTDEQQQRKKKFKYLKAETKQLSILVTKLNQKKDLWEGHDHKNSDFVLFRYLIQSDP